MIPHSRPWILPSDERVVQTALRERAVCTWHASAELTEALVRHAKAASGRIYATGTLALRAALRSLALPDGSTIGIPAFTCPDVLKGVLAAGYEPLILDCDDQGLLAVSAVSRLIDQGRLNAIVVVHQFGLLHRDIEVFSSRLAVVEDCSHVPPGFYISGSAAAIGSMEGTKFLGAGEGGYFLARQKSVCQFDPINDFSDVGNRLSDLLAVLAIGQLKRMETNILKRERMALRLKVLSPPGRVVDGERGTWFRFVIRMDSREDVDRIIARGHSAGIAIKRPIMPAPLHRLWRPGAFVCPTADRLWDTWASVPLYPALTDDEFAIIERFMNSGVGYNC